MKIETCQNTIGQVIRDVLDKQVSRETEVKALNPYQTQNSRTNSKKPSRAAYLKTKVIILPQSIRLDITVTIAKARQKSVAWRTVKNLMKF